MAASSGRKESSIVQYLGGDDGHRCGYCKNEHGFVAPGMWAHKLTVQDIQDLTDRGWRRSGKYCYKPDNSRMCCPLFIIRCDAPNFTISKSQKKVLKKLRQYLLTGNEAQKNPHPSSIEKEREKHKPMAIDGKETSESSAKKQERLPPKKGAGPDPSKPPCRKAKDIRKERKLLKQQSKTSQTSLEPTPETSQTSSETSNPELAKEKRPQSSSHSKVQNSQQKPLEQLMELPPVSENTTVAAHKLEIRLVRSHPQSPEFIATLEDSYQVYKKYQINIHGDQPDDVTMKKYTRFLVDSPLVPEPGPSEWDVGYGSYHQQYYLDGRLIMVGVVDIFPNCLSSKYLYYDTDYEFLSLGVVSALNEIRLTRRLHSSNPSFRYYCMGYYNHTCQKMRYKGQYAPSFLLCTETNVYVPIEKCTPKLDSTKYTKLADNEEPNEAVKNPVESYVGSTRLIIDRQQSIDYAVLKRLLGGTIDIPEVVEYAQLVGPAVAKNALMILNS